MGNVLMKTSLTLFIVTLQVVLFSSCGSDQANSGDKNSLSDTTAFKQSWKMQESIMLNELFAADTFYNQLGLDTFELTYTPCDCPDWIDVAKLPLDCKECSDFYVDPADHSLALPEEFMVAGNVVRYYAVRIPGMNLPSTKKFQRSDPPAWTVVRYYGYQIIRPYKIMGPNAIPLTIR
jgi:hypothetical protein